MAKNLGWLLPDTLTGYDLLCVTLKIPNNLEYRAAFMGALHMLEVWFNWEKTGDTRAVQAAAYWRDLLETYLTISEDENCGTMAFQLRQNPDNSCQLQQSSDGGENWTLAFDYSLCIPPAQQTILDTVLNNSTYVSPNAPTITFISSTGDTDEQMQQRWEALCYAAQAVTTGLMQVAYQARLGNVTVEVITAIALGAAAVVLAVFDVMTWGALTPLLLGVTAAALAAQSLIDAVDVDAFNDPDNIAAMACLMFKNLANRGVSLANFQQAYTGAECLTSDQQAVAAALTGMLANATTASKIYTEFLNALGTAVLASQSGFLVSDCSSCDDSTWQWRWDMCENADPFTIVSGSQTSSGVQMNPATFIGWPSSAIIDWDFFIPSGATIELIKIWINAGNTNNNRQLVVTIDGTNVYNTVNPATAAPEITVSLTTGHHTIRVSWVWNDNGGTGKLQGVGFEGTGTNPFGACDRWDDPACWTP